MNLSTYNLIGAAYREVEEKEAWCSRVTAVSDIAILSYEACSHIGARNNASDTGAARILLEGKYLFDIIDTQTPFENYSMLILPDHITPGRELAERLSAYLSNGGKILATGEMGLDPEKNEFAVDLGAEYEGVCAFRPSYMIHRRVK